MATHLAVSTGGSDAGVAPLDDARKIVGFPISRYDRAVDAIQAAYTKIARAAERQGQAIPPRPSLTIARTYVQTRCDKCLTRFEGFPDAGTTELGARCEICGHAPMRSRAVYDLDVVCERPQLAGWEFLAVVEPLIGGNLVRQVPGALVAAGELAQFRSGDATRCDHCRTARARQETFIVRADGSDPAIAAGTFRQVGRSCLESFLGGLSAASILAALAYATLARAEDCDGGGEESNTWHDIVFEPLAVLTWSAAVIRLEGFTSRKRATDMRPATSNRVEFLVSPAPSSFEGRVHWSAARERYKPTDADRGFARDTMTWLATESFSSDDYLTSLKLVAAQPVVASNKLGILVSAIDAYGRAIGKSLRERPGIAGDCASAHVGTIGARQTFGKVTLERVASFESEQYGTFFVHAFRDERGSVLVWKTHKSHGYAGDAFTLVGTVKKHDDFRGEAQTELARCKLTRFDDTTTGDHGKAAI